MTDYKKKIKELKEELKNTKYNKSTQHHIGRLKAKIARFKEKAEKKRKGKSTGGGYQVKKTGDATVAIVGFPSCGKSTLLRRLTNAEPEIGSYEFTTLEVIPGIMEYNGAKIQMLDLPGIISGAAENRGRGKEVLACLRGSDLILILVDGRRTDRYEKVLKELHKVGIRPDQKRPDVKIRKKGKNGIRIGKTVELSELDEESIKEVLKEFRINNAEVVIREDITLDQFIDCIEDNKEYISSVTAVNKKDLLSSEKIKKIEEEMEPDVIISAGEGEGIEELKEEIFEKLRIIKVFMKEPGSEADKEEPLIIEKDSTIRDVCKSLHKNFVKNFKFARVWGESAKFEGQKLMLDHELEDEDVVELHID